MSGHSKKLQTRKMSSRWEMRVGEWDSLSTLDPSAGSEAARSVDLKGLQKNSALLRAVKLDGTVIHPASNGLKVCLDAGFRLRVIGSGSETSKVALSLMEQYYLVYGQETTHLACFVCDSHFLVKRMTVNCLRSALESRLLVEELTTVTHWRALFHAWYCHRL